MTSIWNFPYSASCVPGDGTSDIRSAFLHRLSSGAKNSGSSNGLHVDSKRFI